MRTPTTIVGAALALLAIVAGGIGVAWVCALDGCCDDLLCVDALCAHCAFAGNILLPSDHQILPHWSQVGLLGPDGQTNTPTEPAFALYRPPRFVPA